MHTGGEFRVKSTAQDEEEMRADEAVQSGVLGLYTDERGVVQSGTRMGIIRNSSFLTKNQIINPKIQVKF